jgi:hypothetical protein
MKRIKSIEDLQDAIILNKEIYFSLYHEPNEGKHFQQLLTPEKHIESLKDRIIECDKDPIRGIYSSDTIC